MTPGPSHWRTSAEEVRARLTDARALCAALGLKMGSSASKRQALASCPWHAENTPSCSVRLAADGTLSVRCHACGESGDALSLVAQVRGTRFRETLLEAARIAGVPSFDVAPIASHPDEAVAEGAGDAAYHSIWEFALAALEPMRRVSPTVWQYLDDRQVAADAEAAGVRGLPPSPSGLLATLLANFERRDLEQAGLLRRGRDALDWPEWSVLIPWRTRFGAITCVQRRTTSPRTPKYRSPRGRSPGAPFGVEHLPEALRLNGAREVVIVEGALDCLARRKIARDDRENSAVLGVCSAAAPLAGLPLDLLAGRRVVLALDTDEAGERACGFLGEALGKVAGELVRERPSQAKDWGEAILRGGE